MQFFETLDEVDQLIEITREKLSRLEEDVDRNRSMERLRASSPHHPVLLGRALFVALTILSLLAAVVVGALPFVDPALSRELVPLQNAIGMPIPVLVGLGGLISFVAFLMASQAAVLIGRDGPLLPWEKKERERLASELTRLTRQRQMMERVDGTPMGARPRSLTPAPLRRSSVPGVPRRHSSPVDEDLPSYAVPAPSRARDRVGNGSDGGGGGFSMPKPSLGAGQATRGGTPLGAPNRTGTPVGSTARYATPAGGPGPGPTVPPVGTPAKPPSRGNEGLGGDGDDLIEEMFADDYEGPTDQFADASYGAPTGQSELLDTQQADDSLQAQPSLMPSEPIEEADVPEGEEEWLIDAVEKAAILAESFPVQARLEFNQAEGLPFTLVLERATPAMAVRAMMAYVEFLASIATPPRARVELISIPHLDRSFHRNVKAALDPYFPGTADVAKDDDLVNIAFSEPDFRWKNYPFLPT